MLSLQTKPFPRSQSAKEHQQILDAAIARDADTAERILAGHILEGAEMATLAQAGGGNGKAGGKGVKK
jgi:DNA-binding GntR family transcriptional regulator